MFNSGLSVFIKVLLLLYDRECITCARKLAATYYVVLQNITRHETK